MKHIIRLLLCAAAILMLQGCSTTRRIPEGEMLYTGIKNVKSSPPPAKRPRPEWHPA